VKEHREDCRENLNRMFREARLRYLSILEWRKEERPVSIWGKNVLILRQEYV
jgi:hypothetical protein